MRLCWQQKSTRQQACIATGNSSPYKLVRFEDSHMAYGVLFPIQMAAVLTAGNQYNSCGFASNRGSELGALFLEYRV
jgi:hypothetical protein